MPRTVELPQQKADSKASNDAIIVLSFHSNSNVLPNVTKYAPMIAESDKLINLLDNFYLSIIEDSAIAKTGCNFCNRTTTDRFI